jgi:hypothetical protein
VEAWVLSYFSDEFHLPTERIPERDTLKNWGYDDEKALAYLAGQFNRAARIRPQWNNVNFTPTELIVDVRAITGATIGDLIDVLTKKVDEAAVGKQG